MSHVPAFWYACGVTGIAAAEVVAAAAVWVGQSVDESLNPLEDVFTIMYLCNALWCYQQLLRFSFTMLLMAFSCKADQMS